MTQPASPLACAYHPDRPAGVGCQRCGAPLCGACMIEAPVGHQCPRCVAAAAAATRQHELPHGGRRSARPQLTSIVLIVVNVAVWAAIVATGGMDSLVASTLALTPAGLCTVGQAVYTGVEGALCTASGGTFVPGPLDGGWWQVLTNAFTHESPLHLGFNMFVLWSLGPQLEQVLGRARFLALYLVSALTASATILWLAPATTTTLGASGAVFGLLGALLVIALRHGGDVRTIGTWIAINVVISVVGAATISWQGHLGGFVGGALLTWVIVRLGRDGRRQWIAVAAITLVALAAMVARALLG